MLLVFQELNYSIIRYSFISFSINNIEYLNYCFTILNLKT